MNEPVTSSCISRRKMPVCRMRIFAVLLTAGLLLTGCVGPKIDWGSRVGHYTFDQAITEFGPPDKSARLSDGSTVAEWLTRRPQVIVQPDSPFISPGYGYPVFPPTYSQNYIPGNFLRLTFAPDGRL